MESKRAPRFFAFATIRAKKPLTPKRQVATRVLCGAFMLVAKDDCFVALAGGYRCGRMCMSEGNRLR